MKAFSRSGALAAALLAFGALGAASTAQAHTDVVFSVGVPVQPQAVYYGQAPVYAPPVTYVSPPVEYVQPYGDSRWEAERRWRRAEWRHREWERHEWQRRHEAREFYGR